KDPTPASQIAPGISADFDYVLSRALAKDPTARYQRGNELAADLKDLCAGCKPGSIAQAPKMERTVALPGDAAVIPQRAAAKAPASLPVAPQKLTGRGKMLIYLLAAAFLLLAGAGLLAVSFNRSMPATLQ